MDVTKALLSLQCAAAARVAGNTKGFVAKGPREHSEPEPDQPGLPGLRSKRRCLLPQLTGTHPACPARTLVSLQACLSSAEPRLSPRPGEHEIVEPGPLSASLGTWLTTTAAFPGRTDHSLCPVVLCPSPHQNQSACPSFPFLLRRKAFSSLILSHSQVLWPRGPPLPLSLPDKSPSE